MGRLIERGRDGPRLPRLNGDEPILINDRLVGVRRRSAGFSRPS